MAMSTIQFRVRRQMSRTDLSTDQWKLIEPLLPSPRRRHCSRGRPACDDRAVLNGILWVLLTGATWMDLPTRYPSRATCHRRFQKWCRDGTLKRIFQALVKQLDDRNKVHWNEVFIDGTFRSAKKGVFSAIALTKAMARNY